MQREARIAGWPAAGDAPGAGAAQRARHGLARRLADQRAHRRLRVGDGAEDVDGGLVDMGRDLRDVLGAQVLALHQELQRIGGRMSVAAGGVPFEARFFRLPARAHLHHEGDPDDGRHRILTHEDGHAIGEPGAGDGARLAGGGQGGEADESVFNDFASSLTVVTTFMNAYFPNSLTTDAGAKALTLNKPGPWVLGEKDFQYNAGSDEFGVIRYEKAERSYKVGDKLDITYTRALLVSAEPAK